MGHFRYDSKKMLKVLKLNNENRDKSYYFYTSWIYVSLLKTGKYINLEDINILSIQILFFNEDNFISIKEIQ